MVSVVALVLMVLLFGLWRNVQSISKVKQETLEKLETEKIATLAAKDTAELRRIEADTSAAIAERQKEKAKKETLRADEQKQLAVVAKNQAQSNLEDLKSHHRFGIVANSLGHEVKQFDYGLYFAVKIVNRPKVVLMGSSFSFIARA